MPFYVQVPLMYRTGQTGGMLGVAAAMAYELPEEKGVILSQATTKPFHTLEHCIALSATNKV